MDFAFRIWGLDLGLWGLDLGLWRLGLGVLNFGLFSGHCEPLKWREEPHQSPKFVDCAMAALLPNTISKASWFC